MQRPSALLVGSLHLSVQAAVLCLSSKSGGAERPLAEVCLRRVSGKSELEAESLSWELGAQLAVSVFSASHAGWEPLLEPWQFQTTGVLPVKR